MDKNQQKQANRGSRTMLIMFNDISINYFLKDTANLKENRSFGTEYFSN